MSVVASRSPVVRRYAEALFAIASDHGLRDEVLSDLVLLHETLARNPDLRARLFHRLVPEEEKRRLVETALVPGRRPVVANLLRLLVARRRESVMPDLLEAYSRIAEQAQGIARATVETAMPPEEPEKDSIRARLEAALGKKVILEFVHVPELIGGMRVRIGDRVLDGSLARELDRIRTALLETRVS